jgi:hypothetical protein
MCYLNSIEMVFQQKKRKSAKWFPVSVSRFIVLPCIWIPFEHNSLTGCEFKGKWLKLISPDNAFHIRILVKLKTCSL